MWRLKLGIKMASISRLDGRSVLGVVEDGTALAPGRSVQSAFRLLQHTQDIPILSFPLVLFCCMRCHRRWFLPRRNGGENHRS